jgi:hypothetical protein
MICYVLYSIFVIVWIAGVYMFFIRDKYGTGKQQFAPEFEIIATPNNAKIRVVFEQNETSNLDIKSLTDFTVKYSDLIAGNYTLPKVEESKKEILMEKNEPEKAENLNLSDHINIFTINKL